MKRYLGIVSFTFLILVFGFESANAQSYESILKEQVKAGEPGLAAIVKQGDKVIYSGAQGMANIELNVPLTSDSVFRLGSITKQFTTAAIMMLQEQGKLSIDDDIHKYVPDFPTDNNKVTIRHLMTHTSGINNYTNNKTTMETLIQAPTSLDDMLTKFAAEPMLFKTGEQMRYSNTGYVILGKIIELVSEQSYADFIEKNIFQKLGMKNSQYGGRQIIKNRALGYTIHDGEVFNADLIDMSWPHAAGSLISTVGDLAIWNDALVNGKVVSQKSFKEMTTPFTFNNGNKSDYGFGLGLYKVNKYDAIGHGGGIPGFTTNAMYIAEKDLFIAVFSNSDSFNLRLTVNRLAAKALNIALPNFSPAKVSDKQLKKLMGTYRINDESTRTLTFENGKVFTQRDGGRKWPVTPMSNNSFYYEGSLTYFKIEESNNQLVMKFYSDLAVSSEDAVRE